MKPNYPILAIATAAQAAFAVAMWLWLVEARPQNVANQFWGHFGPASLLVLRGMVALIERGGPVAMGTKEAWLAIAGGGIYILADTFIMHPPWGVFDGAGKAEQEHVTIMAMVLMLGVSALAMLRKFGQVPRHRIIGVTKPALPQLPKGYGSEGLASRKPMHQMRRSHRLAGPGLAHS